MTEQLVEAPSMEITWSVICISSLRFAGLYSCTALRSIYIRYRFWSLNGPSFGMTVILSFTCQTDGLTFDSNTLVHRWVRGPVATKQGQSSHHRALYNVFVLACCVWFLPNVVLLPNISILVMTAQRTLFQMLFQNLSCAAMLFFIEKRLSPANPSKQAILVHSFSDWTVMNLNI